ncbi:MAG: tRNA (adenosine(37)-N6)-threonylcarbamoyltransferase complex dimerization subunit type 1 TsaB [Bifidobacteriaceae bacterium]|jgi:tRNA threonylcarbamoyladenosine biosynthesis protein TsaB|nr:tRNA (adenosine(37)-N6)-threonylcarbamoyltransferase complex dimerization subunit type 1 TsaB [Bifidobacteriaceae bacterium]
MNRTNSPYFAEGRMDRPGGLWAAAAPGGPYRLLVLKPELPGPVLGIETSAAPAVALAVPGRPPLALASQRERAHAEELAPLIQAVLAQAGIAPAQLAAIAVGAGPAPYTGLRIGLATARALGLALAIPVWGVSALDVLATGAAVALALPPGATILATGDAKRREVYWARYRVIANDAGPLAERLTEPSVGRPSDVARASAEARAQGEAGGGIVGYPARGSEGDVLVGGGALAHPDQLPPAANGPGRADPAVLARLAAQRAAAGRDLPAEPLYLRRPDVAPPGPRKRATA